MDVDKYNKLISNIEDFVFIEEKIVTCLWLCQFLKIHVNTAKQLLESFVKGDAKNKVQVTYLIGGDLKDGEGKQLKLVDGKSREDVKSIFSSITTDHIYSVQKAPCELKPIDIYNAYPHFAVDVEERSSLCAVKPSKDIEKREIKQIVYEPKKEISKPLPTQTKPIQKTDEHKKDGNSDSKEKKQSPEKNNKSSKAKPNGIASMFSKQSEKRKNESTGNQPEKKVEKKKSDSKGISGFLQKQTAMKKESANDEPMDTDELPIKEKNKKIESNEKTLSENKIEENKEPEVDVPKSSKKEKKSKGKENRKKRKKRDEDKDEDSRKKRKRIVSILSSESESSGNEASDVEMEPEPPPVAAPQPEEDEDIIPPTPGRKRVRKQIDKTYTDEDGFILTKKEYIYESCTDDEEEGVKKLKEETKKEEKKEEMIEKKEENKPSPNTSEKKQGTKKNSKKNQISPATSNKTNKQQSSIMSFFKKK